MFYRFKHRFLTGWLRLYILFVLNEKYSTRRTLPKLSFDFFKYVFCCSYIVPYHHMLISSYFQVNQFHVFHMWNFAIYGRHYSGNIKVRMRRKIFQLQRNFIEVFFTERDVILLVFRFLDTESLQDIPDAEDKLMCLHSTASKKVNKISTMPMVQNILRMCADDSDEQGTCFWLCKTEQPGVAIMFSDNENC